MAMQTGMGLSKIIILLSAGYTGTILMKNGKLSDLIGELQAVVKGLENNSDNGNVDDPIVAQVHRLAQEIRQLASSRQVTVFNGGSGQTDVSSLILPAATLGALGYGYMWWKGMSFSDLMYVTKRNMTAAVQNLTKHLDDVKETLVKTKRHLTQRIENLHCKADEQKEMSKLIMNEVQETRGDVRRLGTDLFSLQNSVYSLEEKILSLEDKQTLTLMGVNYLLQVADGRISTAELSKFSEVYALDGVSARAQLPSTDALGLLGLKEIAEFQDGDQLLTQDRDSDFVDKSKIKFSRSVSAKCSEF